MSFFCRERDSMQARISTGVLVALLLALPSATSFFIAASVADSLNIPPEIQPYWCWSAAGVTYARNLLFKGGALFRKVIGTTKQDARQRSSWRFCGNGIGLLYATFSILSVYFGLRMMFDSELIAAIGTVGGFLGDTAFNVSHGGHEMEALAEWVKERRTGYKDLDMQSPV